jgi:hypothetical protein
MIVWCASERSGWAYSREAQTGLLSERWEWTVDCLTAAGSCGIMLAHAGDISEAMTETSRRGVPIQRAWARWEPGAESASKIPPELLVERLGAHVGWVVIGPCSLSP